MALKSKRSNGENSLNMVLFEPRSNWKAPTEFPDLTGEKILGIDIESRDPDLLKTGPGFIRGAASVVGISVATTSRGWYFPIGHLGGGNMARERVIDYFNELLSRTDLSVVGANLIYDIEGLDSEGIPIAGRCLDIQIAEPLIDEEQASYSLETLSHKYLGRGKEETFLRDAAACYGINPKSELWKLPAKFVGPYAEADALQTIQIFQKQLKILEQDDLLEIFQLESELTPILWLMRKNGIPVDLDAAEQLSNELHLQEQGARDRLKEACGFYVNEWSQKHIEALCRKAQIIPPVTKTGRPSFTGDWLESQTSPMLRLVATIRELNRLRSTFIDEWFFKNQVSGRIHPQWHQLRSDDGGTRTGRLSASNPNPQQIPGRSELSALIRKLFVPDRQGALWGKFDYSQQEPRILVHYAALCGFTGAGLIREAYRKDSGMDIYQFLAEACNISRRDAKDATLGRCYGMGVDKFSGKQGISYAEAKSKLEAFDDSVPFVKEMANYCNNKAQERGWIKTLCGRKRHFTFWEPVDSYAMREAGQDTTPVRSRELARQKWPDKKLKRALTHKALNSLIQGSAADMTKAAMILVHKELDLIPYMQVHDELNFGVTDEKQALQIKERLETCVKLEVPIKCDMHLGKSWK